MTDRLPAADRRLPEATLLAPIRPTQLKGESRQRVRHLIRPPRLDQPQSFVDWLGHTGNGFASIVAQVDYFIHLKVQTYKPLLMARPV